MARTKNIENMTMSQLKNLLTQVMEVVDEETMECATLGMSVANILRGNNVISEKKYKLLCEEYD